MSRKQPPKSGRFDIGRRNVLTGLAAAAGSAALPGYTAKAEAQSLPPLPEPEKCGIDHIVVVMMENRSFDHFLGWVPGADGRQAGVQYPDKDGVLRSTFRLSTNPEYGWQGCDKEDPDHGYAGGRKQFNGGAMNGWLQTVGSPNDYFPIGYYTAADVPFFKGVADNYTIGDRFFCGILSSTFPNRMYSHAGQTDRNTNTLPYVQQQPSTLPNIWGLLQAKSVKCRYYYNDLPFLGLWGPTYMPISKPYAKFLTDAAAGTLQPFSYIDPFFGASVGEGDGIARDDHPSSDIRDGQAFLDQIYNALRTSPQWDRTLLIISYDEWGGFYDHVAPPTAPVSDAERNVVGNDGRLGFRVPLAIVGPRARKKHVTHLQFDPNSILNFVRWRFRLGPLSARDSTSLNLAYALNLDSAPNNLTAPKFSVEHRATGFGTECSSGVHFPLPNPVSLAYLAKITNPVLRSQVEHLAELQSVLRLARSTGWPV